MRTPDIRALGNDLNLGQMLGDGRALTLPRSSRDKHLYIAGATGTGKSKFLEHLVRQDIIEHRRSRCGLLLIDPHGSLYDSLMNWMALTELDRPVIPIDLRRDDWVVAYNLLRKRRNANAAVIVDNMVQAMVHVWGAGNTDQTPRFARWAGNTLHALYENELTLSDAMHLFGERPDVREAITADLTDKIAQRDWRMARDMKPKDFDDQVSSTINRLQRFLRNDMLRCIFGQSAQASLDLSAALDEGHIILVSLARDGGRVSKEDADLFATLLLTDLWTAAQERGKRRGVKPFYVYMDEFQRFVTPTIAENLDEARGFGLHLTMAHQFPKQLLNAGEHGRRVYDSIMENASSKIVFRLADQENLEPLARWLFMRVMDPDQVKHQLYSTKVVDYSEEERITTSRSRSSAHAVAHHESTSSGESTGASQQLDEHFMMTGSSASDNSHLAQTAGETHSFQESETEGESRSTVLIPVLGQELSHVQFRSLDEQLHRCMIALFDQEQRQCVARLVGMKAPASLSVPFVSDHVLSPERLQQYVERQLERWPFALRSAVAYNQLTQRALTFADQQIRRIASTIEPSTTRRRLK
jgi:hypothetical protein